MAKRKDEPRRRELSTDGMGHNPFAKALSHLAGAGQAQSSAEPRPGGTSASQDPQPLRVTLRRERKGRGGHPVVLIEGLERDRREWVAARIGKGLGCRSSQEGELVLVGVSDTAPVEAWLRRQAFGAQLEIKLAN